MINEALRSRRRILDMILYRIFIGWCNHLRKFGLIGTLIYYNGVGTSIGGSVLEISRADNDNEAKL